MTIADLKLLKETEHKFEDVPLMRVGGSLRNMSDEEMFAILSEQEPDFSGKNLFSYNAG